MKAQVYETVEQHLKKERALKGKGIKVLSLFFIDRVANYRIYNEDGTTSLGKIGQWFEEAYQGADRKADVQGAHPLRRCEVHNGYFSQDKQGHAKDTRGNTADDDDTYNLIMRDKERLLDPDVALRFIFSHSALREGWDNPNVFQICTLNETQSLEKKRQEIGRGLRLPVNAAGERVHDETVNRLTVIANESYEEFARTLQTEFEEDFGIQFGKVEKIAFAKLVRRAADGTETEIGQDESGEDMGRARRERLSQRCRRHPRKVRSRRIRISSWRSTTSFADLRAEIIDEINRKVFKNRIVNARERRELKFRKEVHLSEEFQALWDKIKHRTRYRVTFETADLVARALARIKQIEPITAPRVATTVVEVDISDAGVSADKQIATRIRDVEPVRVLPDILGFLQKETELTRHTLAEILKRSGRLAEFKFNPQAFMAAVAKADRARAA